MKRKTLVLGIMAFALVLGMNVAPAWGYFTDTTTADGGLEVSLTPSTDIYETWGDGTKTVVISNKGQDATIPVFVRAQSFAPKKLEQQVLGEGWVDGGDGWWYYGTSNPSQLTELAVGEETTPLTVKINLPAVKTDKDEAGEIVGTTYNVVVVYEATPAAYNADGTTAPNWDYTLDSGN